MFKQSVIKTTDKTEHLFTSTETHNMLAYWMNIIENYWIELKKWIEKRIEKLHDGFGVYYWFIK